MKHKHLNYGKAHKYVDSFLPTAQREVFWDGYDIVIWKRNPGALMTKSGMFRNGQWGAARRIKVSDSGTWRLPETP